MTKKTIALTGSSGTMGFQTFLELYQRKDVFDIVLLNLDDKKARKKFKKYENDPSIRFIWGNLTCYQDVLDLVTGADYVLHVGGMVSPSADYYPKKTLHTNMTAMENIVKAVKAQPDPDGVKVVYIGSVAQTGDRNPPIHWGRCGDPIKISVYDHYAISKVKAEAILADSGLKYWVSLRQSGILYPDILKNMEPIMYHVPLNGVLEWTTVEDSGRLLKHLCLEDLPEHFWRRFYNIGSGEAYRLTNYEFEELILETLGLGSPKQLFFPHWFTTQNFHGQWFLDGDELENYLHFRANIPIKDYFKEMMKKVELLYRFAFLGRPYAPILKHTWMKSIASTPYYGTLWWAKHQEMNRMNAYYGGMEAYESIPKTWDEFKLIYPSKNTHAKEIQVLDHGYDESKDFETLTLEDLQKAAIFRGGRCLAPSIKDMYTPIKWQSARGTIFEMSPNLVLRGGHWCLEELPWPWDEVQEASLNPFFAQVCLFKERHIYDADIFQHFKEPIENTHPK